MNTSWKNTIREIKGSFSRYIAIFAIIALGAGLFVGLRMSRPDFIETLDRYVISQNFFDYRLVSTLGLTADDVEAVSALSGVAAAEGVITEDFLYSSGSGENLVMTANSIPEKINLLDLTAGRLPEKGNECLADPTVYSEADIGRTIKLSADNSEDTFSAFAYDEYIIVGLAESVSYINIERGSTTLGSGSVEAYLYIPADGFCADYFTDIYVTVDGGGYVYSDEYDNAVQPYEQPLEDFMAERAVIRYNDIIGDANAELDKAREQYEAGLAEYEAGLAKYNAGLAEYESRKAEAEAKLENAARQIADAEKLLADPGSLDEKEAELNAAKAELDKGYAEYEAGVSELKSKKESSLSTVNSQIAYYSGVIADREAEIAELNAENAELSAELETASPLRAAAIRRQISNNNISISTAETSLSYARTRLEKHNATKAEIEARFLPYEQQLADGKAELDKNSAAVNDGLAQIAAARQQIAGGASRLEAAKKEYEQNRATVQEQFAAAKAELDSSKKQLDSAKAELDDAKLQLDDAQKQIKNMNHADTYVLGRDTNIGYVCFENDTEVVDSVAAIFPLFFFLIAALVCLTTMTRMVSDQRTQIGIMKALGYGPGAIVVKYLFYSGSATLLGSIFGIAISVFAFPAIVWLGYGIMYNFGSLVYTMNWALALGITAANLAVTLLVTWLCCKNELKSVAAELIRPKAPESGQRILLERIGFIWNRMSFMWKVSSRNIMRYKKRIFMMLLGIGGCTALVLTALGLNDTTKNIVSSQYDEICLYDCELTMAYDMTAEERDIFLADCGSSVSDSAFIYRGGADISANNVTKSITLTAATGSELDGFVVFKDGDDSISYPGLNEAIINRSLADSLGVTVGDEITLKSADMQGLTVAVSGLFDNYIDNYAYVTPETCAAQWGKAPELKSALIIADPAADIHEAGAHIGGVDGVRSITLTVDSAERIGNMMSSLNYIIMVIVLCAGLLAFIVLYNLTNINISERIREIATIKVLGFYPAESAMYVFRENMVLTGMGAVFGLGLGVLFHAFVMSKIKVDMMYFAPRIEVWSYILAIVLTFAFAIIVNIIMRRRIDNIDMAGALKSIE